VVSPLHETLVDLFERSPVLLQPLAGRRLRVLSRKRLGFSTDHTRVSELRVADSDIVLKVYSATGKLACAIVFEVQLSIKKRKARAWPLYASWVHQRLGCPVHVVVLTVSESVAAWAAGPFCIGDMTLRPWVIGPEHIPPITSFEAACAAVDLTFLAGLAHAKEPIVLEIGRALWHALDVTRHEHADLYWDIFMHQVHTAIRRSLEMELQGWKPQSPWGKRIYAEGVAKGEARGVARGKAQGLVQGEALGVAKGKAESVLALLRLRGVRLTRAQREQILSCRDERRLRAWLRRACMVSTAAELFEPRGRQPTTASTSISIK
jgi:hypothetical protein